MRVPFPLALNVGSDLIACGRLTRSHASKPNQLQRIVNRFLHPSEVSDLTSRFPRWTDFSNAPPAEQKAITNWLAGRWAAKEAAKKAWGASLISFKDVRTEICPTGEVHVLCQSYNDPGGTLGSHSGLEQAAKLSISHDGEYAIATVIATPLHPQILALLVAKRDAAAQKVRRQASSEDITQTRVTVLS